ncbi:MAG TPA: hypothetical protein VIT44_14515, partial [Cyclobacteriaceae bacterium]
PLVGGLDVKGLIIAPAYMKVGFVNKNWHDGEMTVEYKEGVMKGVSISAFNHITGTQRGLAIGVFNFATTQRGLQLGVLNYVKDNPKGLRLLPIFNMHFGKKKIRPDTEKEGE